MPPTSFRQQDLANKVAVITGASRGIGRAIAVHLASRGCHILGTYSQPASEGLIVGLQHEIEALFIEEDLTPPTVTGLLADIFSPTCALDIASALEEGFQSRIDILINSAADPNPGELGELTVAEIQKSLLGNIQTPVLIVDELVKRKMFQTNSRIIYISSIRSRQPWAGQLMYSAGKSAGESLCRTWSQAFGGREEKVLTSSLLHISSTSCIHRPFLSPGLINLVRVHGWHNSKRRHSWPHRNRGSYQLRSGNGGNIQTGVSSNAKYTAYWTASGCR